MTSTAGLHVFCALVRNVQKEYGVFCPCLTPQSLASVSDSQLGVELQEFLVSWPPDQLYWRHRTATSTSHQGGFAGECEVAGMRISTSTFKDMGGVPTGAQSGGQIETQMEVAPAAM